MDDARFDTWTRRRFGLATGGAVASLLGLAGLHDADARKNRKRRRRRKKKNKNKKDKCAKIGQACNINVKNQRCCNESQDCAQVKDLSGNRCCKPINVNCKSSNECCGSRVCAGGTCQNVT